MKLDVHSSLQAFQILKQYFNHNSEEVWVFALNTQLRVIKLELMFRGTVDQCQIHPRDVFRFLITHNASSFIISHNHPSLDVQPSQADIAVTKDLLKAAAFLKIPMQDHIIFSSNEYFSMADRGLLKSSRKSKQLSKSFYNQMQDKKIVHNLKSKLNR